MAGLVQRAEERVTEIVLLHARRDPHVAERERGLKRMMRLVLPAAIEIVAKTFDDFLTKSQLSDFGKILREAEIVRGWLRCDRLHDGNELFTQLREDLTDGRSLHTVIR